MIYAYPVLSFNRSKIKMSFKTRLKSGTTIPATKPTSYHHTISAVFYDLYRSLKLKIIDAF